MAQKLILRKKYKKTKNIEKKEVNNNLNYGRSLSLEDFANFTKTLEDVVFPKCQVSKN